MCAKFQLDLSMHLHFMAEFAKSAKRSLSRSCWVLYCVMSTVVLHSVCALVRKNCFTNYTKSLNINQIKKKMKKLTQNFARSYLRIGWNNILQI